MHMEAMMKIKNLILFLVLFVLVVLMGANSCYADGCPVQAKILQQDKNVSLIEITSIVNTVTIQEVKVNNGYGLVVPPKPLPHDLKLKEKVAYLTSTPTVSEVTVKTNKGNCQFTVRSF